MAVSMRVMSAGDGYKYLLRTVAAADGDRSLSTPLTRYYNAESTPPGRWLGAGVAALGSGQIIEGDQVSEAQLQLLVGMGRDPITGKPLGRAYPEYQPVAERIAERVAALDPALGPVSRAEAIAAIEAEEGERGRRRAVAGYDCTFSIPKSASVLWAVADAGTQALIAQAHHAAVAEVVAFMEREVVATRTGATARNGAVAQADVTGLIATAFDHYNSRGGDPHLHTHVVISNKVQTVLDGKWRSLDGRPMHAATVALPELHEAVFADHLTRMFGVEWEAREKGRDRNPTWAVVGVPGGGLVAEFSIRSRHIDAETDRLIDRYVQEHGRRPSRATIMKLRAQATLSTRPEKDVHSLADLTADWRARAGQVLGADATSWARLVTANEEPLLLRADDVPLDVIASIGAAVVEAVGEKRSTWRRWNLTAEAARQTMGYRFASTEDREAVVGLVADAAEAASLRLTPPELASSPAMFRRTDGTSVFRPRHSTVFSSEELLAAENRLLDRSRTTTGPTPTTSPRSSTTALLGPPLTPPGPGEQGKPHASSPGSSPKPAAPRAPNSGEPSTSDATSSKPAPMHSSTPPSPSSRAGQGRSAPSRSRRVRRPRGGARRAPWPRTVIATASPTHPRSDPQRRATRRRSTRSAPPPHCGPLPAPHRCRHLSLGPTDQRLAGSGSEPDQIGLSSL
nr:MobF family relaxase [Microbacterium luticocti]